MTTIRSTCPRCGEVDMQPPDVRLVFGERTEYTFTCPICGNFVVKRADRKIVGLLQGAGVESDNFIERPERSDPSAPPLTLDDLIDFHEELENL